MIGSLPVTRPKFSAQGNVARLIRERDAEVMEAADDTRKAYEVAAGLDAFARKLVESVDS